MALNIIRLGPEYFPSPTIGRPIANADIYVGIVDLDPTVLANQKQISVQQENGTLVQVAQPISTGAGGVPLYLGSPVTIFVDGSYSMKVLNKQGGQEYYIPKTIDTQPMGVNVLDYGAVGDGITDDTAAIQAAVDYMKTLVYRTEGDVTDTTHNTANAIELVFPAGLAFVISSPIDMTGIRLAHSWWYVEARGAVFFLRCTGKTGFDLTDSRKCSWLGGTVIGEEGFVCRTGIQIGRNSSGRAADSHHFQDLEVKGYFTLASYYNYASEDCLFDHVALKNAYTGADTYCLVQDGDHYFGIESDYQTPAALNTAASFLSNDLQRLDARLDALSTGSAVWMSRTTSHRYRSCYVVSYDKAGFVLFSNTTPTSNKALVLDVHIETDGADLVAGTGLDYGIYFDAVAPATAVATTDLVFRDNFVHSQVSVFGKSANVTTVNLTNIDANVGAITRDVGQTLFDTPADYNVNGRIVTTDTTGNFDLTGLVGFSGEFNSVDAESLGRNDSGSFVNSDAGNIYQKNKTQLQTDSSGAHDIEVFDEGGVSLGKLRWANNAYDFEIGGASVVTLNVNSLFPSANGVTDLGLTSLRYDKAYINELFTSLPTSDPSVSGQLWNDAGTVKVSA